MKNAEFLAEKLENGTISDLWFRFFTGPDTDGPETELRDHRIPLRFELFRRNLVSKPGPDGWPIHEPSGPPLLQVATIAPQHVPLTGAMVARFMDCFLGDRRLARVDLALMRYAPDDAGGVFMPEGSSWTVELQELA